MILNHEEKQIWTFPVTETAAFFPIRWEIDILEEVQTHIWNADFQGR